MHPYVHCSIIYNGQIMKAAEVSINRWMDKLVTHKKECTLGICNNMHRAREYNAKWNKSARERQIPYDFTYTWNLRNKTDEHRGRGKKEREGNHERLLTRENKLRISGREGGGGCAKWVMGMKEGTCWDEYWVLYVSDESVNSTPETNTTLYVN